MKMKSSVFCLISLVLATAASAQELQQRRTLGSRLQRPAVIQPAAVSPARLDTTGEQAESVSSLQFSGTLEDLLNFYSEMQGVKKTILKDPAVKLTDVVTFRSPPGQKLEKEEKITAVVTVLEMNGVHVEPYGESFIRALPRKNVRKEGIPLYLDEKALEAAVEAGDVTEGKVISFMIRFKYISEEDMEKVALKVLESFKSDSSGAPVVLSSGRRVLITDTYLNIKRMLEMVAEIDVEQLAEPLPEVECIQIKNANASDIVPVIEKIVSDSLKEQEEQLKKGMNTSTGRAAPQPSVLTRPRLGGLLRSGQSSQPDTPAAALVVNSSEAAHGIIKGRVTVIAEPKSNKIILITKSENMQMFKKIIDALDVKTTLDTDVKVYRLKYADAEDVSDMFNDLINNSSSSKDSKNNQNQNAKSGGNANLTRNTQTAAKTPANRRTGEPSAGELNKDNTTVLADKRINGVVVMSTKELFPTIEKIIESMDVKLSQVLIETAIIEVTLGKNLNTGVDWVQNQWMGRDPLGKMGGGGGSNAGTLTGMSDSKTYSEWFTEAKNALGTDASLADINTWINNAKTSAGSVSPIGSGINYLFKSDKLNLNAVISAAKTDSNSKYLASPIIMTVDNKEAKINATDMTYLLKGFQSSGNSYSTIAVPDYEQKELGIEIKVTPKINPNGTVMLTVETKYTQKGAEQTIKYTSGNSDKGSSGLQDVSVPTTATREMSADVLLENMQTVILGGLTDTYKSESETGIPFLKDIPIIGKWLFGKVVEDETRKELLIFMTPYVMDDGAAAQAEALRRKKTMSDSRPWEDNSWSLSKLADPVSKKEQMRRINEEWKKQDEERKTKIAIEKMKVERAEKLKKMSIEERALWLKMHKEELDEEAQDELEEKMLDEKSQKELKKLAAEVRAKKLAAADVEIKKMEEATAAENERAKLDAEKMAKSAAKSEEAK